MYYLLKRTFDVLSSGIVIIILSPLFIPIIIGLKFTGEGYILYKQEWIGYKNKHFLRKKYHQITPACCINKSASASLFWCVPI